MIIFPRYFSDFKPSLRWYSSSKV